MKPFNKLSPAEAERLALLAEECGEVVLAVGKILRHGYESVNPYAPEKGTNRMALADELGDVAAATKLLQQAGDVSILAVNRARTSKLQFVQQWMHHQRKI
jgi:NTP pyrophosphatase (non-canonical NTP hydrolase)